MLVPEKEGKERVELQAHIHEEGDAHSHSHSHSHVHSGEDRFTQDFCNRSDEIYLCSFHYVITLLNKGIL